MIFRHKQDQLSLRSRKLFGSLVLSLMGLNFLAMGVAAADLVVLKYSILQETVSVAELSTLANTGEVSPSLAAYLDMANQKPEELRDTLNKPVDVDPTLLSKILKSFAGEYLLDRVSEVIHTPSQSASRQSLRGALVSSALPDGNIRLIEVLENYPTSEVHVNGDRLATTYKDIKGVMGSLAQIGF